MYTIVRLLKLKIENKLYIEAAVFYRKGLLKNFAKFIGRQLCQGPFSNKFSNSKQEECNFIKKDFMFHKMTLKLHFMKYSERKISQCILPFSKLVLYWKWTFLFTFLESLRSETSTKRFLKMQLWGPKQHPKDIDWQKTRRADMIFY